jgi:ATP-dependent Clp endopeptidase proteolytic subunit ClpP
MSQWLLLLLLSLCLQRIVRMGGPVDDDMANLIVAQLLYLDSADQTKDITMYVNSPGGSVTAGEPTRDNSRCKALCLMLLLAHASRWCGLCT